MTRLYTSSGEIITLGNKIGHGGEGAVFEVTNRPDVVAKVYHRLPGADRSRKIECMVQMRTDRLAQISAWPLATLHEQPRHPLTGFLMPRVTGFRSIHELYGPKSRMNAFPSADWSFLISSAANLARAFNVVHEHNLVIGDVNHDNALVSQQATVTLIDCDSFQVTRLNQVFHCEVGVATHTPPELQGQSLNRLTRSANHDAFGLAVLIFQLLFMGRHPFSGVFLGPGDMPLDRAIKEFRFAYGSRAGSFQMQPPPATLTLTSISSSVATLFERAFSPDGQKIGSRPQPLEWVTALTQLLHTLRRCPTNPAHQYPASSVSCPWCHIEAKSGLVLFGSVLVAATTRSGAFRLDLVWAQISAIPNPGPPPGIPRSGSFHCTATQEATSAAAQRQSGSVIVWIVAVAVCALVTAVAESLFFGLIVGVVALWIGTSIASRTTSELSQRYAAELSSAEREFRDLEARWQREATDQAFHSRLTELSAARQQFLGLDTIRASKVKELQTNLRKRQLEKFLDRHRVDDATITGVGPTRKATLQSFGIETALDVTYSAVINVPGFGPSFTRRLVDWRNDLERRFVFNPSRGPDPADVAQIDREIVSLRQRLEQELGRGVADLQNLSQRIKAQRQNLMPLLEVAARKVAQAEANRRAL